MILLHDALTILSPIEERWQVKSLLEECMSKANTWEVEGRKLQFGIDVAFAVRWGMKPTDEQVEMLYSAD